ncbi:MAG: guanylate kinase [Rhizobiales bacterium 65-9]|nr:guanylate kinase [Hyphomicrobiales bacterium]OJY37641.1 MAG: guanylate kinase [Rhizobiales bacterium 65-9]
MSSESTPKRRGLVLIVSSPSGAGKTTLTRALLDKDNSLHLSVSVTTRPRRANEVNGVHYHFLKSVREFEMKREAGELLEWAQVHGEHFYGTPREPVEKALMEGRDVLFDIDVQGAAQVTKAMRRDVASVFVLPPSVAELHRRLQRRAAEDETLIRRRLATARKEIARWSEYDYVIVNDDLDRAFSDLRAILSAERQRRARRVDLEPLVSRLDADLATLLDG